MDYLIFALLLALCLGSLHHLPNVDSDRELSDKVTEANLTIDERRWKLVDTIELSDFHQKIRPKNTGKKVT